VAFSKLLVISITVLLSVIIPENLWCETFRLKNGDILTGKVIEKDVTKLVIEHPILGRLTIPRDKLVVGHRAKKSKDEIKWERKVAVGFDKKRGNTNSSSFSADVFINRKTSCNEATFKAKAYYSSTDKKMDDRKLYSMARYAYSFGKELRWYQFFKTELEHDRFADVKCRFLPSIGVGYWFSDELPLKAMIETSVGDEITDYYSQDTNSKIVAVITGMLEKKLWQGVLISQYLTVYPSFENGNYRLRSETTLKLPLTSSLGINFSLIDEYDSSPASLRKSNDLRLVSSLEWSF